MSIDLTEIHNLPVADKIRLITSLWEEIAASPEALALPESVLDEATRRSEQLRQDPSLAIDEAELWRRVDGE